MEKESLITAKSGVAHGLEGLSTQEYNTDTHRYRINIFDGKKTARKKDKKKEKKEEKKEEEKEEEKSPNMYENIVHRPLRGRCPKWGPTNQLTNRSIE